MIRTGVEPAAAAGRRDAASDAAKAVRANVPRFNGDVRAGKSLPRFRFRGSSVPREAGLVASVEAPLGEVA